MGSQKRIEVYPDSFSLIVGMKALILEETKGEYNITLKDILEAIIKNSDLKEVSLKILQEFREYKKGVE